ncbi:HalD/BesD family halogenase [Parafrankia sp. FMc2]|uniref:HalD/BesD family halogenase n=1 Tax=Parafrankia sp. FMc2 TaxID=3233196 RepID=UPI003B589946
MACSAPSGGVDDPVDLDDLDDLVDTDRYPLTHPAGGAWLDLVARIRRELETTGCSVLTDFVRPAAREALRAECAALAPSAYYQPETVNAYNIDVRTPLPEDHPGRIVLQRGNAFVAADLVPDGVGIRRLYSSGSFQRFVAACCGLDRLYELADPLAQLCLNVIRPGDEHPWHFDTNEFSLSLLTQESEAGGVFEYCPDIRSAEAENLEAVRDVLTGRDDRRVQRLVLRPGDLQLFRGRFSLHRVSPVQGGSARHSAIFAYCERPGVIGSVARTKQLFGRVLPEHLEAARQVARVRGDRLLD